MNSLAAQLEAIEHALPQRVVGEVHGINGLTIRAKQLPLPVGSICEIRSAMGRTCAAEVVGFDADETLLMPLGNLAGVTRGDAIESVSSSARIACSPQLLGRVLNGFGKPRDGSEPLPMQELRRIDGRGVDPMQRVNIRRPVATGIRAIDALHTCGLGQRMGIFSAPGIGKSTLVSSIARNTDADVSVIALIGERGREVNEFLDTTLGHDGLKRCVVVVSTGDDPPLLQVRAARVACAISEYFREQGKNVLLLMDSLTRLCHAQRQIGLAAGEPPATRGYPPSVFAILPEILERAGNTEIGSITGFYSVLVENDDFNEPIAEAVKAVTDGHLWLSAALASRGHFPAIDVLQSISRVRGDVSDEAHVTAARRILSLLGVYRGIEDLVNVGAYVPGADAIQDLSVKARPLIANFLQQEIGASFTLEQAKSQLMELCTSIDNLSNPAKPKVKIYRSQPPVTRHG